MKIEGVVTAMISEYPFNKQKPKQKQMLTHVEGPVQASNSLLLFIQI